jgi:hypothetical protein
MAPTTNTGTGVLRSVTGVSYLDTGKTITGTSAAGSMIAGGQFSCILDGTGTLNGTAVVATGVIATVSSTVNSVLTSAKHVSAGTFWANCLVKPTSGLYSILHLGQGGGSTTVNEAIYIEGTTYVDNLLTLDVDAGLVISKDVIPDATPDAGHLGATKVLRILIGSTPYYIPLYDTLHA